MTSTPDRVNGGSPSKEPLMSPARGIGRGNKQAVPKAEQPSPVHARVNVSYKCITPGSTPGNSPLHSATTNAAAIAAAAATAAAAAAKEQKVNNNEEEEAALLKSAADNCQSSIDACSPDQVPASHVKQSTCSPIEELSTSDLHQKLDKVAWQSMCSSQYSAANIKKTRSDTILSLFSKKSSSSTNSRQTKSASSLPSSQQQQRTGTVRQATNVWSGEQMRADMVDLSELYANPNNLLSVGILTITVGCVSLALSLSSAGMKLWFDVGCVALGIGMMLIGVGSAWYYITSRLIYVVKPDVEIKVVSGTEAGTGATSANGNGGGMGNARSEPDGTGV